MTKRRDWKFERATALRWGQLLAAMDLAVNTMKAAHALHLHGCDDLLRKEIEAAKEAFIAARDLAWQRWEQYHNGGKKR